MQRMPLTPNGKVDRTALPLPDVSRPDLQVRFVAPRTPTEQRLAALWAEVLGLERVGMRDNFFALGGHSLLATQVVSRIRQQLGIELPLRDLFEEPTIANLAAIIDRNGQQPIALPPITPADRQDALPLSFGQERLWFLDHLTPNSPLYNIPAAVRITGPLNADVLRTGLNEVVRRHESLRTCFETIDGQPSQTVAKPLELELPLMDFRRSCRSQSRPEGPPSHRRGGTASLFAS